MVIKYLCSRFIVCKNWYANLLHFLLIFHPIITFPFSVQWHQGNRQNVHIIKKKYGKKRVALLVPTPTAPVLFIGVQIVHEAFFIRLLPYSGKVRKSIIQC